MGNITYWLFPVRSYRSKIFIFCPFDRVRDKLFRQVFICHPATWAYSNIFLNKNQHNIFATTAQGALGVFCMIKNFC